MVFCMSFLHVALLLSLKWSLLVTTLKSEVLEVKAGSKYCVNIWGEPDQASRSHDVYCPWVCAYVHAYLSVRPAWEQVQSGI